MGIHSKISIEAAMLWTDLTLIEYIRIEKELKREVRLLLKREEHNRLLNIKVKVKNLGQKSLLYLAENMIIIKNN